MRPKPFLFLSLALVGTSLIPGDARAQAFSQIAGSSGSVAGKGQGSDWAGLAGSAARATIDYQANGQSQTPGDPTKFATNGGAVQGKDLPGFSANYPGGYASSQGASTVSGPPAGSGAPTYYNASWTANQYSDGTSGGNNDSGTFDPYDIRRSDVSGLAAGGSGPLQLYFQSGIRANGTVLRPSSGSSAAYGYSLFTTEANGDRLSLLNLNFSSNSGLDVAFTPQTGFDVYLLGSNGRDTTVDPDRRIAGGQLLTDARTAAALVSPWIAADGSLKNDVLFGVRRTFVLPAGGAPDDVLFTWHTDTSNRVAAVPEPASLAALAIGAAALLRRRRKA